MRDAALGPALPCATAAEAARPCKAERGPENRRRAHTPRCSLSLIPPPSPAFSPHSEGQARAKALSNMVKQKRKEKAGKWAVPLPKVKAVGDNEVMKVMRTGKRQSTWGTRQGEGPHTREQASDAASPWIPRP